MLADRRFELHLFRAQHLLGSVLLGLWWAAEVAAAGAAPSAFPGAEGFGAVSVGGRGGQIIQVTNLNDSGPGSLRAAIDTPGPRIVVFRVGGRIWLDSRLEVKEPFLTVAGQTAPGGGIEVANALNLKHSIRVETHDVVIRHLRIRRGPGGDDDSIEIDGSRDAHNVVIDHCSISWAVDENITVFGRGYNVTLQWSIVSEALNCSTHPAGCQSNGSILGSFEAFNLTAHHNLFAHNAERNPRIEGDGVVDFVNNVIYNPRFTGGWGPMHVEHVLPTSISRINVVNNYYKPGPASGSADWYLDADGLAEIYAAGNEAPAALIKPEDAGYLVGLPLPAAPVSIGSADDAYDAVLAEGGAGDSLRLDCAGNFHPRRDSIDTRIVDDVQAGTGAIIDDPSQVGGYPPIAPGWACVDSDEDGMPDTFELRHGFDPHDASDGSDDLDQDGYTNVEEYLNGTMARPVPTLASPERLLLGLSLLIASALALRSRLPARRCR